MDIQLINFKPYSKGHLIGFFDLAVCGLVVCGCKVFRKGNQLWFGWPSEKTQGRNEKGEYRDIISAAAPVMEHLQRAFRAQLRPLIEDDRKPAGGTKEPQRSYRTPEAEDLSQYHSGPADADDDIPF